MPRERTPARINIIFTALNRVQAVRLRNYIRQNDPEAFILISNTSEIIGKGFP